MKANSKAAAQQRGFTMTQMVITLAIIAIVSTFGVLGIKTARAQFQLQNAARLFASYVEKARADSIRRHAATGEESSIEMFGIGTTAYNVTMDFGAGVVETRTFQLDPGLTFGTDAAKVTFDWRGRLLGDAVVFQIQSNYLGERLPVDVSGSGDITVGNQRFPDQLIPAVEISEVIGDVDTSNPDPTPTPSPSPGGTPAVDASPSPEEEVDPSPSPSPTPDGPGNSDGNPGNDPNPGPGATPSPNPNASPTPSPSPSPTAIPQCVSTISPSTLSLSQTDPTKMSGSATFTMTNATGVRIISASQAGNGNALNMSLSLQRIDGNGSSVITVSTKQGAGNRGVFVVQVQTDPVCGSTAKLTVSVSN